MVPRAISWANIPVEMATASPPIGMARRTTTEARAVAPAALVSSAQIYAIGLDPGQGGEGRGDLASTLGPDPDGGGR